VKDSEFNALKLTMSVIPERVQWDEPRFDHWVALHAVADEARARVGKVDAAMDAIEHDVNLTAAGKRDARAKVAAEAVAAFEKSQTLQQARSVVKRQCQTWDDKFGISEIIKPVSPGTITQQWCMVRYATRSPR
jgi:hypothetical protein